jgi:hypothetical protein
MDLSQGRGAQGEYIIIYNYANYEHEPNLSIKSHIY